MSQSTCRSPPQPTHQQTPLGHVSLSSHRRTRNNAYVIPASKPENDTKSTAVLARKKDGGDDPTEVTRKAKPRFDNAEG